MTSFCKCSLCEKVRNDHRNDHFPECSYCNERHNAKVACPEYVAFMKKCKKNLPKHPKVQKAIDTILKSDSEYYIEIAEGKYTLYQTKDGEFKALRYGEPWQDLTGNKMVFMLMFELIEAKKKIKDIKFMIQQNEYLNGIVSTKAINDILNRRE